MTGVNINNDCYVTIIVNHGSSRTITVIEIKNFEKMRDLKEISLRISRLNHKFSRGFKLKFNQT